MLEFLKLREISQFSCYVKVKALPLHDLKAVISTQSVEYESRSIPSSNPASETVI